MELFNNIKNTKILFPELKFEKFYIVKNISMVIGSKMTSSRKYIVN